MLNEKTREILGQLGNINQTQIISYPVTVVKMGKSIQAFLDLSKKDEKGCAEEPFEEFGIYTISELNSVINVIEKPEISLENGTLIIKNEKSKTTYKTTPIDLIESKARGNADLINRMKDETRNKKVLTFELSAKELNNVKKMSSLLKELSDLKIIAKDGEIGLLVTSVEKSSNTYKLNIQGKINEELEMTLLMDSVNKLPISDYEVSIVKSKKGSLVAIFTSLDVSGLDIVLTSKA